MLFFLCFRPTIKCFKVGPLLTLFSNPLPTPLLTRPLKKYFYRHFGVSETTATISQEPDKHNVSRGSWTADSHPLCMGLLKITAVLRTVLLLALQPVPRTVLSLSLCLFSLFSLDSEFGICNVWSSAPFPILSQRKEFGLQPHPTHTLCPLLVPSHSMNDVATTWHANPKFLEWPTGSCAAEGALWLVPLTRYGLTELAAQF